MVDVYNTYTNTNIYIYIKNLCNYLPLKYVILIQTNIHTYIYMYIYIYILVNYFVTTYLPIIDVYNTYSNI